MVLSEPCYLVKVIRVCFIDNEEFIAPHDLYSSIDPDFPYDCYTAFDLNEFDESESVAEFLEFRFPKRDVRTLSNVLQIPDRNK